MRCISTTSKKPIHSIGGFYGGSLVTKQSLSNIPDHINEKVRAAFGKLVISDRNTNQPEVFKYGIYQDDEHHTVYRLEFYEAVLIYVLRNTQRKAIQT